MSRFQILCTTMHQNDFSKMKEMNIHSDVVFANQADTTSYSEMKFEGHRARMITTGTKGVGVNRNIALMYADSDICLFADDDMTYVDNLEELVLGEFSAHPDADLIVFNVLSNPRHIRVQKRYYFSRKHHRWERMPWGAVRIAFRLSSVKKANIWFTTLFGGGTIFASGEDSIWLNDAKKKGLCFYTSKEVIGEVNFASSTWYSGRDEKLFYARGAYIEATHKKSALIWVLYYSLRFAKGSKVPLNERIRWMNKGRKGFKKLEPYQKNSEKTDEI